jgi:hypothetical protein
MKRLALVFVLAGVLAPSAQAGQAYPTRLQVVVDEFFITFSRSSVPAGQVKIELVNYGEDPHNLRLQRRGSNRIWRFPETAPGNRTIRTIRMRRGRWHVWCTTSDHENRGMHATLRVKAP